MDAPALRDRLDSIPREPGVYQFTADDTTLYVGKAIDLRDRLGSYLDPRSERIAAMRDRADDLEVAVTDTETQALLLEANLIKRHQPRYNVRLTDDKSYPLVQLTDHEYPRIEVTRDPDPDAMVFGPYTARQRLDTVVKALRDEFGLRGCSDHKFRNRDRPCLDYELGLCAAPCVDKIDPATYDEAVLRARRFFEGEVGVLAEPLETAMETAARERVYERAATMRDRLEAAQRLHGEGEAAVSAADEDRTLDVIGVARQGNEATVARLHSEAGQLVERTRRTMTAPDGPDQHNGDLIEAFLTQYYADRSFPDAILVPELPPDEDVSHWLEREGVELRVPGAGREATLLDLAMKNANRASEFTGDPLAVLGDRLDIERPTRIEGFDVSHAQGRAVVGANVTFVDGSPENAHYRRKRLEAGNDDVERMRQLVAWRAERAQAGRDDRPDPDLLLIDGGRGQLNAAREALTEANWERPIVALAKREETVVTTAGSQHWPDDDPALHLLQQVRDEAHRFAVSYHQTVRDTVETVLDEIPGVGPTRRRRLLRRFGSLEGVRTASVEELTQVEGIGESTARELSRRL